MVFLKHSHFIIRKLNIIQPFRLYFFNCAKYICHLLGTSKSLLFSNILVHNRLYLLLSYPLVMTLIFQSFICYPPTSNLHTNLKKGNNIQSPKYTQKYLISTTQRKEMEYHTTIIWIVWKFIGNTNIFTRMVENKFHTKLN